MGSFLASHKVVRISLLLFGIFIVVASFSFLFGGFLPRTEQLTQSPLVPSSGFVTQTAPKLSFDSYINQAGLPALPPSVTSYSFKTHYSQEDIAALGSKFNLTQVQNLSDPYVLLYNTDDPQARGYITFNKLTGAFSYISYGAVSFGGTTPETIATAALVTLGFGDQNITCPITYKKSGFDDITFVECHRDWTKTGLPILGMVGLINTPENTRLSNITVGNDLGEPQDESIVSSNPLIMGRARPNDFNTITIGVGTSGNIASIVSNMRKIESSTTHPASNLLSAQDALQQFMNKKSHLDLTLPAGTGSVDFSKVYQDGLAKAQTATISDYILTYEELPANVVQETLVPMYQIKGIAKLTTGYTVKFSQMIPALKEGFALKSTKTNQGMVAGASTSLAQANNSIQIKPFYPTPSVATSTVEPEIPLPTATAAPTPTPGVPVTNPVCTVNGGNAIDLSIPGGTFSIVQSGNTYYFKQASVPIGDMKAVRSVFYKLIEDQYAINMAKYIASNPTYFSTDEQGLEILRQAGKQINGASIAPPPDPSPYLPQELQNMQKQLALNVVHRMNDSSETTRPDVFPPSVKLSYLYLGYESGQYATDSFCYLSGGSPSLYFYPERQTNISLTLPSLTTYIDPAVSNTVSFIASPTGDLNISGILRNRVYYEFNTQKVHLVPSHGIVVSYSEVIPTILNIAQKLGLTQMETNDFVADAKNALQDTKGETVTIGFVDQKELNSKLALVLSPTPDTLVRIHLILSNGALNLPQPSISKIDRSGFTVVELGVTSSF